MIFRFTGKVVIVKTEPTNKKIRHFAIFRTFP